MNLDPSKFGRATIVDRHDFSEDLWTIRVALDFPFSFKPGQYATLGVTDDEGLHERAYSIVSSPREKELEFFIELVPQGELTPRLYKLKKGDSMSIRRSAKGLFTLDRKSGHTHHLQVATVTGVAPFLSVLRTFILGEPVPEGIKILLLEAASRSWEFPYVAELDELARKLPFFQVVHSISRPWEDKTWTGEKGRAEDLVRKYADAGGFTADRTTAYLCGHPQMIENTKSILSRVGFEKTALHEEIYWIPKKSAAAGE